MKKEFNEYLDEVCRENKREKARKKQIFNENVKPHIVYMDDDGKIYKKKQDRKQIKNSNFEMSFKIVLCSVILALLIYIIYELVPLLYILTN